MFIVRMAFIFGLVSARIGVGGVWSVGRSVGKRFTHTHTHTLIHTHALTHTHLHPDLHGLGRDYEGFHSVSGLHTHHNTA
ncbi:hypothetical protein F5Y14DRAFT_410326 [Nemania sp. NC0429]|nr:hypothetical protein F5Y14DRAFT_410326 [Nemania sp. NC0429]